MSQDSKGRPTQEIGDLMSAVSFQINIKCNKQSLATGTGFLLKCLGKTFLVTNWHNVTAIDPNTNKPKNEYAAIPDQLEFNIPYKHKNEEGVVSGVYHRKSSLNLFDSDGNETWIEHPKFGRKVDVVLIPIVNKEDVFWTITDLMETPMFQEDFDLMPGQDVFILGFPFINSPTGNLTIWKRGTIASEPHISPGDLPMMYVDTATREGMSGSPVFAQISGYWLPKGILGNGNNGMLGIGRKFLGIYSGRIGGDDAFKAQLGIVWKTHVIDEIADYYVTKEGKAALDDQPS